MSVKTRAFLFSTVLLMGVMCSVGQADELRDTLFSKIDTQFLEAKKEKVGVLAPYSYNKAVKAYNNATTNYEKKRSVERVQEYIGAASEHITKALRSAKIARLSFESVLKARNDAINAKAKTLAPEQWAEAEEQFASAAYTLETDELSRAQKRADEAEALYRSTELVAIKAGSLSQARDMLAQAKKEKVSRYAPKTFGEATILLAQAEKELSENRYDTDYPRSLVKQSLHQAKHAIYLAKQIKSIKKDKSSMEDVLLEAEQPVVKIADALDIAAELDQGVTKPAAEIVEKVEVLRRESYELNELQQKMAGLQQEMAMLENQLGIQSERIAMEEERQATLDKLNAMFTSSEAVVMTQGDNILIRAVGLTFDPGSAVIKPDDIFLLKKMQDAIALFPNYMIVVEGHTDSFGGDAQNLALSLQRAKAIQRNLIASVSGLNDSNSLAKGHGETKPIANNETPAGRAKNRRIDLLFKPKP